MIVLNKERILKNLSELTWESGTSQGSLVFSNQQIEIIREQIDKVKLKDDDMEPYYAESDLY